MKLYTNPNNSLSLKIIISSLFAEKEVPVEIVKVTDKAFQHPKRLPVLELDSENVIFSSNAASLYFFRPATNIEDAVNEWLDWDSVKLQPVITFISGKFDSGQLDDLINELDANLKNNYLVAGELTVADVCVWSTLYPITHDDKLRSQFLKDKPNLLLWNDKLESIKQFQVALQKFVVSSGLEALQSVTQSCWYPTPASSTKSAGENPAGEVEVELSDDEIKRAVDAWESSPLDRLPLKIIPAPVLPVQNNKNILITSALPYVNNVPHLGNIIGCVLSADVFARYCRFRGWNTLYICGTDEYGTATETKAVEEKVTPLEICEKYHAIHNDVYHWFNISFDHFGRTTTPEQTECVQNLFKACYDNGYTSTSLVDQLLCENCDRYLADRFVEGICPDCKYEDARGDQCDGCGHLINAIELIEPRCKLCQKTPVVKQSKQLFLDLSKIVPELSKWVEKSCEGWTHNAKVITKAWLKEGLKPRCITRDLKWGVPVPLEEFEQKVFYVWFDAPIGYMSLTKCYTDKWLQWWKPSPTEKVALYQFMAKDNVPFHSIMFPATLIASKRNYTLLNHLMATEYLNYENGKFSKSRGIGVFGNDAKDTGIPSDIFRFYLLYIRPESADTNFSWADLAMKNNTELLNNLGNFIMRSLSFAEKFFDSKISEIVLDSDEKLMLGHISVELKGYLLALDKGRFKDGIKYILNISRHGNQYMQSMKPWVLIKGSDCEKKKASTVISLLCNIVCLISSLLQPFMPETVKMISKQVNTPVESFTITEMFQLYLKPGHVIGKPFPLFNKIEQVTVDSLKARYAGKQNSESPLPKKHLNLTPGSLDQDKEKAIIALTDAVTKQGDLVRSMKSAGKKNNELKPYIDVLLDLKKQLLELSESAKKAEGSGDNEKLVAELEEKITQQGGLVRKMKTESKTKEELKPEIDKLLDLKKQLSSLKKDKTDEESSVSNQPKPAQSKKKNKKK